jgi:hypothetical protein
MRRAQGVDEVLYAGDATRVAAVERAVCVYECLIRYIGTFKDVFLKGLEVVGRGAALY